MSATVLALQAGFAVGDRPPRLDDGGFHGEGDDGLGVLLRALETGVAHDVEERRFRGSEFSPRARIVLIGARGDGANP